MPLKVSLVDQPIVSKGLVSSKKKHLTVDPLIAYSIVLNVFREYV